MLVRPQATIKMMHTEQDLRLFFLCFNMVFYKVLKLYLNKISDVHMIPYHSC